MPLNPGGQLRGPGARAGDPAIQARRVVDDARYYTASLRRRPSGGLGLGGTGRQEGGRQAAYRSEPA